MSIMGTTVEEVMTPDPVTLEPGAFVADAWALMSERGFRHVPIVLGGTLVGLISMTDIGRLGAMVPQIMNTPIVTVMTRELSTIGPHESVDLAAAIMGSRKINCLLVVDRGAFVGIVTTYDLLDALARRLRGQE